MGEIIRAAGVIFVAGDNALFLQRSATGDHAGEWCVPGGKLEAGESAEEAARRECREEIGRMPKGTLAVHCRRISTVIPEAAASVDLLAPPVVEPPQVDFTTFIMRVKDEFEPTLNEEHTGWSWAPISSPPLPMHPGAAAALAKFTMNEYDIAVEIMSGGLTSPQQFMGLWLFDMRITGTGMSFRAQHKEFVMRDPAIYLNEYFLARCNGLEVIVEHPPDQTMDTEEYRDRTVGSVMLPYIGDGTRHPADEVWGIVRIRDAACAAMLTDPDRKDEYSTSPTVVFRKSDGNTSHVIDGQKILVEGPPSFLDHLAICRLGVWDKGGAPNGIVSTRGDSDVAEKKSDDDMMSMMDAFRADMGKFADAMKDCTAKMDSHSKRMDSVDEEKKKADAAKAKADADEEEKKKADAAKAKADSEKSEEEKKADAKAKADAEEEEKKKADAAKKSDEEKEKMAKDDAARADALVANHPLVKEMRDQLAAMSAKLPAVIADADRGGYADAQARADVAYSAQGQNAPPPMNGELLLSYRRRLANGQKSHSKRAKDVDVLSIADDASLKVFEDMIYADSLAASRDPTTVPAGQLRAIKKMDHTGMRQITEFTGDPSVWMGKFGSQTFLAKIKEPQRQTH